ncbi:MAG: hypothetical protein HY827_10140 [Actinobacteria bacterium]|nr:hypothetical protein [Actinomycetota bacterium]
MPKPSGMRDQMLHDALRQLTEDAARLLESRLRGGEEIPFEVGETVSPQQAQGTALFAYKPMTAEFVSSHADQLRTLPSFESAANHLARTRGTVAYLRLREEPVLDVGELTHARLGALAFLAAVWSDAEHFDPWQERFAAAFSELESAVLAERLVTTVFIPVHGVVLDCDVVNLGAGVELMATEDLDAECLDRFSDAAEGADCYCAVSVDAPSDAPAPMAAVRQQARSLLTALRMFKPGSVSLGMAAQANIGGAWQQVALPFTGRSREEAWRLLPGEDEELRQFIGAVRRVDRRTRVAWALKRFEMGLERSVPAEGLTDFLAALRALLEAHDDTGKSALPARVSALCARDSERVHVRATVEAAFALERLALDGHIGRADRKRLTKQPPLEVIAETERYLRALLHDLVCGYLATDLKKLADEILLADGEPTGDQTASHDPVYLEPVPDPGAPPRPDPTATQEFEAVFDDTAEIMAVDTRADAPAVGELLDFPGASAEIDGWTLRPASEIKPAPELESDGPFESAVQESAAEFVIPDLDGPSNDVDSEWREEEDSHGPGTIPTYAERETDARMRQLAEELVSDFDDAFSRTMEADALDDRPPAAGDDARPFAAAPEPITPEPVRAVESAPSAAPPIEGMFERSPSAAPPIEGMFERPPSFELQPRRDGSRDADPLPENARRIVLPDEAAAEAGFTFDFKVVEPVAPPPERSVAPSPPTPARNPDAPPIAPKPDAEFAVPEFELPGERGAATADSDAAVDARGQSRSFKQIMDENFTPPPRDLNERPSTPVARNGRPHLVAIDGASAREPHPEQSFETDAGADRIEPLAEVAQIARVRAADDPDQTIEFDVLSDFDESDDPESLVEPVWTEAFIHSDSPVVAAPPTEVAAESSPAPPVVTKTEPQADPPAAHEQRPATSESARTYRIGPATIEFRPLVESDDDDPDDFAGAC